MKRPLREKAKPQPWPWHFSPPEDSVIFAIQALAKGIANAGQQQRAYAYILRSLCEIERMSFWPGGEEGRRASDFAEGKRWVGLQLRRLERMRPDMRGMGLPPSQEKENP